MTDHPTYLQPLSPRETEIAWTGMDSDFKRINAWHQAGQKPSDAAPGSLLHAVDAMTEPHQVTHLLGYFLHTAVDHLHALKMLLADAKAQHTFAPYTLIRGAIEAASAALWLLQDGDPQKVIHRAMRLEYMNLGDQRRAARTVEANAEYDEEQLKLLREVLTRNGMTIRDVKQSVSATMCVRTTDEDFHAPTAYLTWQMCSAAAHGRHWAKRFLTLFEAYEDDGLSKTLSGQLSSNETALAVSLRTACDIFGKALTVRDKHSRNPNHSGASFTRSDKTLHVVRRPLILPRQ